MQGRNLEMLRVELDHEEDAIIAEMGRMIYKSSQVRWHMMIPGKGFLGNSPDQ